MPSIEDYETRLSALTRAGDRGLLLEVLGWWLLLMAGLTSFWIWTGWRAGTWFWFWWTGSLILAGGGLAAWGALLRAQAARDYAALSGSLRARLASPEAGERPTTEPERRAA